MTATTPANYAHAHDLKARRRVVLYARGDAHAIAQQQAECLALATHTRAVVVALAVDSPDTATGWAGATAMLAAGAVDAIMVAERSVIPSIIDASADRPGGRRPIRQRPASARW